MHKMREATPEYHKLREKRDRFAYEKKYLDSFLDKLIKGWLAESSDSVVMGVDHPTHVIEKALVSLAWMNTEDFNKPQFLALYEGIPHVLKGNHLDTGEWRREQYKDSDYKTLVKSLNELGERDKMARYLLKHSEVAAFLSHGEMVFDTTKLPEIGYKSITYKSKKLGYDVSFSDCMDSSILNFLANTLRNPETGVFDPDWMQKLLGAREFRINPEFLKFVKNHPSLSSLDSKAAHEEWAPLVSDLQGVNYVQPGYEVDTQVSNIFHILDHLLFNPSSDEAHSLNEESGTTNEMKMNRLCRFLSPKNRELGWSISGGNGEIFNHTNTGVTLHFTLNKQPYFEWIISAGHSEIRPFRLKNKSWKYGLAGIMIGTIKNEKDENLKAQQVQSVVGLIDKDDLELFLETLIQQKGAFRSLNLDSNERKLTLIEAVLVNHLKPYYSFIKKLDKTLPTAEDLHTSQRREAMFAKGDYPFGDPLHLIGKPERTYTRVSKDPKLAANLVAHHGKYFEKAWKDPRGIVWAEPLKSETGRIVGMTHFEATQFCNSIHASLPTGENWRNLMSDMETPQGMIPQFLSDLYGESYWSSTLHIYSSLNSDDPPDHSNPEEAFYFEGAGEEMHFMGDRFFVDFIDRRHKAGVRCITREK
ncbi:MAG: hypothetical protein ABIQ95_05865 [Bdellovibrionia bacterium]